MAHKTLLLLMSLLYLTAYAQPSLDSEVQSMMKDKDLRAAHMGISVTELGTMKSIYQYQGQKMFSTASCLKLLTTACALEYLGEQYQFSTKIYLNGQINNEELNGDIIIEGSGDPTFASSRYGQSLGSVLEDISKSLKKLNISKINGHLCYDVSKFDINPVSPKTYWLDLGNYFGGATWPVNIDENIYRVTFSRSLKVGDSTKVLKIDPPIDITLDNRVTIKGKTDEAFIYCAPYSSYGYIKGTLPPSIEPYTIKGAMPQPLQFFGRELVKKLHSYHIEVPNGILYLSKSTGDKRLVWERKSPPLADIVKQANRYSINLYAEAILRAIGMQQYGTYVGEGGLSALYRYIGGLGLDTLQMSICDGSGVSPANMCSPYLMSQLLAQVKKRPWFETFYNSLSSSGGMGTLSNMGKGTILEGNLHGKSGNMDGICSYAGYIKTKSGKMVSFSILINNFKADNTVVKKKVEKLLIKIVEL